MYKYILWYLWLVKRWNSIVMSRDLDRISYLTTTHFSAKASIEFEAPKGLEMKHLDGKWSYLISHPERPRAVFTQMLDWK